MQLPLFINRRNKYIAGSIMYALGYTMYFLTNHYPLSLPVQLHMTAIDRTAPFLPYTVLIYVSEYIYFAFVYILLKNHKTINQYLYSFFFLQLISCFIFLVYPTIYPRENFPIPSDLPLWLQNVWYWLRKQDAATNCFPSLHVSSVYLSALVFQKDGPTQNGEDLSSKIKYWVFMIWGTLIALSTLTTKQHYVVDIISGFSMAILCYWWFHLKQEYRLLVRAQQEASTI